MKQRLRLGISVVAILAATVFSQSPGLAADPTFETETTNSTTYNQQAPIRDIEAQNPTESTVDPETGETWYKIGSVVLDDQAGTDPPPPNFAEEDAPQTSAAGGYRIVCTAEVNRPHYSTKAYGAISKTRISCNGYGLLRVNVKMGGLISFRSAANVFAVPGPSVTRAQSNLTQAISVNAAVPKTYYTPNFGNAGRGTGFWITTSVWQITSPVVGNPASKTVTVHRTI